MPTGITAMVIDAAVRLATTFIFSTVASYALSPTFGKRSST